MRQELKADNFIANSRENNIESCPADSRLIFIA
jgi:hypothetical protein